MGNSARSKTVFLFVCLKQPASTGCGSRVWVFPNKHFAMQMVFVQTDTLLADADDGLTKIDTTFDGDTVWLSIDQMAELFQRDRSVIGKHVRNIFKEGELQKESVWAKFAYTASDGKVYNVDYYNLDVIISVG